LRLVINEQEAEIVRWIFQQYVLLDKPRNWILRELIRLGTQSPKLRWTEPTITNILTNPAYCGTSHIGGRKKGKRETINRIDAATKANALPIIIAQELWDAAVAKVDQQRSQGNKYKPKGDFNSPVTGLLVCGVCEHRLIGRTEKFCANPYNNFRCKGGATCKQWSITELEALTKIAQVLVEEVDAAILRRETEIKANKPINNVDVLKEKQKTLAERLEKASKRYLSAPDDILPLLETELRELKKQLAECTEQLEVSTALQSECASMDYRGYWESNRQQIIAIGKLALDRNEGEMETVALRGDEMPFDTLKSAPAGFILTDINRFRAFCNRIGLKLTVFWQPHGPTGKRFRVDRARLRAEVTLPDVLYAIVGNTGIASHCVQLR